MINSISEYLQFMEITDIIKNSASELSIDNNKDNITKQKNIETRTQVIEFIDLLMDRELYCVEQEIATVYLEDLGEDGEDVDESSFEDSMKEVNEYLSIVETLAKAKAYLKARHEGITGI